MSVRTGVNESGLLSGFYLSEASWVAEHEGYGVQIDTANGPNGVKLSGAGTGNLGIVADNRLYDQGEAIKIAGFPGQIVQVRAAAAGFAVGDYLKTDATGRWTTAAATEEYMAQALETAAVGVLAYAVVKQGANNSATNPWTRAGTVVRPTTAGDSIATGVAAAVAKILDLDDNKIAALGTDANVDIELHPKGTGIVTVTTATETDKPVATAWVSDQGTTGTGATVGQIAAVGVTANAVILVTIAENPGNNLALSHVVAGIDLFTVYTRNTNTDALAALDTKNINYMIISY